MIDIDKAVKEVLSDLGVEQGSGFECSESFLTEAALLSPEDIPRRLEHSLLTADLTKEALMTECRIARNVQAATVCVAPYYVADAVEMLAGSSVGVCAAVGFPSALMSTEAKIADVRSCVLQGASEIDLAMNIAMIKSGDFAKAEIDFISAFESAQGRSIVKAVFEHGSYDLGEKEKVLEIIRRSGVPYLKIQNMTSGHGARSEDILFVREIMGDKIRIKIDGGVKTLDHAMKLFSAGAYRIGLTATKAIAEEANKSWRELT